MVTLTKLNTTHKEFKLNYTKLKHNIHSPVCYRGYHSCFNTHVHTHTRHSYAHTHTHIYICVHTHTSTQVCTHTHPHTLSVKPSLKAHYTVKGDRSACSLWRTIHSRGLSTCVPVCLSTCLSHLHSQPSIYWRGDCSGRSPWRGI